MIYADFKQMTNYSTYLTISYNGDKFWLYIDSSINKIYDHRIEGPCTIFYDGTRRWSEYNA